MKKTLLFLFLASLLFTLPAIVTNNFYFGFNAGLDAFYLKDIISLHKFYLIAPWSSLSTFFQGSFYYYLALLPFALTGGNPQALVFLSSLAFILTITLGFIFMSRNFGNIRGLIFALLVLFSPLLGKIAHQSGSENLIPFLSLLFLFCLWKAVQKPAFLLLAFFLGGLTFHFQPIVGFQFLGLLIIFLFANNARKISFKIKLAGFLFFFLTFLPQFLFDLRHNFLQTKSFLQFAQGKIDFGQVASLTLRFWEKLVAFSKIWQETLASFDPSAWIIFFIFFSWLLFGLSGEKKSIKNFAHLLLLFLLFIFIFALIIFPFYWSKSNFYLIPLIFILLAAFSCSWALQGLKRKKIWLVLFILFLAINFLVNLDLPQKQAILTRGQGNHNFLKSQKETLDWIYQDAGKNPFKLYIYTPAIYDFAWQYLIFWYGQPRHGFLPQEFAYLPQVPDYLPNKNAYLDKIGKKNENAQIIYILLEPDTLEHWGIYLKNFDNFNLTEEKRQDLPNGIIIKKYLTKKV